MSEGIENEKGALGAILIDPNTVMAWALSSGRITAEMFADVKHVILFRIIEKMFSDGKPIDVLTVTDVLSKTGELEKIGGQTYLLSLMDATPVAAHGSYYFELVKKEWMRRQLIQASLNIQKKAKSEAEPATIAMQSANEISGIVGEAGAQEPSSTDVMKDIIVGWRSVKLGEKKPGLETPWATLNEILGGGLRTGLYLLAGRPSQGKSVLEENIAAHVAKLGNYVVRIAIDMPINMVWARTICRENGVSLPKLNFGHAGESQLSRIEHEFLPIAGEQFKSMQVKGNLFDISSICSYARAMKAKHGLSLLTIDYLQNVHINDPGAWRWQENQKMTWISGHLKRLALELDIPIIGVSQLTRDNERDDRPPRLSDLRGSGSLEQDATVVIFVYRHEKIANQMSWEEQKKKRPVNVDVLKNQNGETGIVECWLHAHYFMMEEAPENFGIMPEEITSRKKKKEPLWR